MKRCLGCGTEVESWETVCPKCAGIDFVPLNEPRAAEAAPAAPASPGLVIVAGYDSYTLPAGEELLLGRVGECPLKPAFDFYGYVSERHATVVLDRGALVLHDLSLHGTHIVEGQLDQGREHRLPLPVTLRFAANCFVHFSLETLPADGAR